MDTLDMIHAEAQGLETEAQAAQDAILNPEPAIDPAESWAQIPKMAGGLLAIAMPELAAAYTDANCLAWGRSMQVVADKYEWDAASTMARFAPEMGLVVASLPLVLPTIAAVQARRARAPEKVIVTDDQQAGPGAAPEGGGFVEPS